MTEWHPDPDQLVALALADVENDDQERLVAHLAGCSSCRDEYAQLSDGLQQTLTAAVSIAPPAGFSGRVLAAMDAGSDVPATGRPPRMRLLMVACVLAGLVLGVGGAVGVGAWLNRPPVSGAQQAPTAARLLTADGVEVGSVGLARRDDRTYLLLNVTAGRSGNRYDCILVTPDGARLNGGNWTLTDQHGRGTASGAWLVPITGDPPVAVELVAPSGTVWARGAF
jgi:hypothetical protein